MRKTLATGIQCVPAHWMPQKRRPLISPAFETGLTRGHGGHPRGCADQAFPSIRG